MHEYACIRWFAFTDSTSMADNLCTLIEVISNCVEGYLKWLNGFLTERTLVYNKSLAIQDFLHFQEYR